MKKKIERKIWTGKEINKILQLKKIGQNINEKKIYILILSIFTVFSQFFSLTNNEKIKRNIQIAQKEIKKKLQ